MKPHVHVYSIAFICSPQNPIPKQPSQSHVVLRNPMSGQNKQRPLSLWLDIKDLIVKNFNEMGCTHEQERIWPVTVELLHATTQHVSKIKNMTAPQPKLNCAKETSVSTYTVFFRHPPAPFSCSIPWMGIFMTKKTGTQTGGKKDQHSSGSYLLWIPEELVDKRRTVPAICQQFRTPHWRRVSTWPHSFNGMLLWCMAWYGVDNMPYLIPDNMQLWQHQDLVS